VIGFRGAIGANNHHANWFDIARTPAASPAGPFPISASGFSALSSALACAAWLFHRSGSSSPQVAPLIYTQGDPGKPQQYCSCVSAEVQIHWLLIVEDFGLWLS
jgi:hypothetical protein